MLWPPHDSAGKGKWVRCVGVNGLGLYPQYHSEKQFLVPQLEISGGTNKTTNQYISEKFTTHSMLIFVFVYELSTFQIPAYL